MVGSLKKNALLAFLAFAVTAYATPCAKPRVRREWRSISEVERKEWLDAVKCLGNTPHKPALTPSMNVSITQIPPVNPNSSHYDDFVYVHMDLAPAIHFTGFFLPWHRAYVNDFENALRTECKYKGAHPYWNWTMDASFDFNNSVIFDPKTGFGGWGDPDNDFQITDGPFAENFTVAYPVPHKIRRNYTEKGYRANPFGDGTPVPQGPFWNLFTQAGTDEMVKGYSGDFLGFHTYFEGPNGSHGGIHQILGGDMTGTCPFGLGPPDCYRGAKWTANDPLFMMHHAMVDKLWYDWQNLRKENFWSFFGGTVGGHSQPGLYAQFPTGGPPFMNFSTALPTDGILREATIYDVMDTESGELCYKYE